MNLVFSSVFLLLGVAFLFFYCRRRQEKELLFFGIGVFSLGIYTFYGSQWRHHLGIETVYDTLLYYAAGFTVVPAFGRFAYLYLEDPSGQEKGRVETLFHYSSQGMVFCAGVMDLS